jgi:hypothetical protein
LESSKDIPRLHLAGSAKPGSRGSALHTVGYPAIAVVTSGIARLCAGPVALSLDGIVSNMFNLSGTISNQFMQMFDLYPPKVSTNLTDWTRLAVLLWTKNNPQPLRFTDTNAVGLSRRFYRSR